MKCEKVVDDRKGKTICSDDDREFGVKKDDRFKGEVGSKRNSATRKKTT